MTISTSTLIWLFPVVFMIHDFEEIMFWERWLKKNGDEVKRRVPAFLRKQVSVIVKKSTAQFLLPVCLIFCLTVLASFLAVEHQSYGFLLLAGGLFFLHGFMHLGQAVFLRRYIPAVITSALLVIPYGLILFGRLLAEGRVSSAGLMAYFLPGVILMIPFILVMRLAGEYLYTRAAEFLIR